MAEGDGRGTGEWSMRVLPSVNHQSSASPPDLGPPGASVSPSTSVFECPCSHDPWDCLSSLECVSNSGCAQHLEVTWAACACACESRGVWG